MPVERGPYARGFAHPCVGCGKTVRWALAYCTLCSWRGVPVKNEPYLDFKGAAYGEQFHNAKRVSPVVDADDASYDDD